MAAVATEGRPAALPVRPLLSNAGHVVATTALSAFGAWGWMGLAAAAGVPAAVGVGVATRRRRASRVSGWQGTSTAGRRRFGGTSFGSSRGAASKLWPSSGRRAGGSSKRPSTAGSASKRPSTAGSAVQGGRPGRGGALKKLWSSSGRRAGGVSKPPSTAGGSARRSSGIAKLWPSSGRRAAPRKSRLGRALTPSRGRALPSARHASGRRTGPVAKATRRAASASRRQVGSIAKSGRRIAATTVPAARKRASAVVRKAHSAETKPAAGHVKSKVTPQTKHPAAPTGRTHRPTVTTKTNGARTMSGEGMHSTFLDAAQQMLKRAATYDPERMSDLAIELDRLPEALHVVAEAFGILRSKADGEWPVNPAIVDALASIEAFQHRIASMAEDLGPLFRQIHASEIRRQMEPEVGAQKWDVRAGSA